MLVAHGGGTDLRGRGSCGTSVGRGTWDRGACGRVVLSWLVGGAGGRGPNNARGTSCRALLGPTAGPCLLLQALLQALLQGGPLLQDGLRRVDPLRSLEATESRRPLDSQASRSRATSLTSV